MRTSFAVHVDCDNSWIYEEEHGMKLPYDTEYMYRQPLVQLLDMLDVHKMKATFFIIGRELSLPACQAFCQEALKRGHRLGNHSMTHSMDFGIMESEARASEIRDCHVHILKHTGYACRAFRAPGYGVNDADMQVLADLGYLYDTSSLPGPTALLLKTVGLLKSPSYWRKSLNVWKNFWASTRIRKLGSIWRVPIAVMPWIRLPVHTSFAFMFGQRYLDLSLWLLNRAKGHHVILLHGLDLADTVKEAAVDIPLTSTSLDFRAKIIKSLFQSIAAKTRNTEDVLLGKV